MAPHSAMFRYADGVDKMLAFIGIIGGIGGGSMMPLFSSALDCCCFKSATARSGSAGDAYLTHCTACTGDALSCVRRAIGYVRPAKRQRLHVSQ